MATAGRDARTAARGTARPGEVLAAGRLQRAGGRLGRRRSTSRPRTTRSSGPSAPRRCTGTRSGTRCSTGRTRRSPSGSSAASSTSPTTASTATSRPATATASPTTGAARRARSSTSPTPTCTRDVQKFANGLKDLGVDKGDVVAIYLPMIPEVAVAMLACARIGAIHNVVFGGFSAESVKERIEFSEAKVLITVDGARRKGKTAPIKETVDEVIGDLVDTIVVVQRVDNDAPMKDGRDHWYHELLEAGRRRVPGRADGLRGPAVHPLHERLDGQAEGHPAHHGRLPDRASPTRTRRSSTSSRRRTSTGARPTSAGSPGTPTSSTGRWRTAPRR